MKFDNAAKTEPGDNLSPSICMVLLPEAAPFKESDVNQILGELPGAAGARLVSISDERTVLQIELAERLYSVLSVDAPIPESTFERALAQQGSAALTGLVKAHTAHLIVTCLQPGAEMGDAVVAAAGTHVLAARLGILLGATAAFWSGSEQVCAWDEFAQYLDGLLPVLAREEGVAFPTRFWVTTQLTRDVDLFGGHTRGLRGFTGYEIDLTPIPWTMEDVAARVVGAVAYLFQEGPVLKDGEALGGSKREKFLIKNHANRMQLRLIKQEGAT